MYYVYIIRCKDNSLYTGITNNLKRRVKEHITKSKKCAKYTKNYIAMNLEAYWITEDRRLASKLEYQIKKLTKNEKEEIIVNKEKFNEYLSLKVDITKYTKIM